MPVSGALTDGRAGGAGSRPAAARRPACARRRPPSPPGGRGGDRGAAPGDAGLAQDRGRSRRLDLELGQVGAVEQPGQPVDEREQSTVAVVAGRRRARRDARRRRVTPVRPAAGRPRSCLPPPEDEGRVLAAEPERVAERDPDRRGCAADVRRQVEALAGRIGVVEVDRRRDAAVAHRLDRGDGLDRAGGAERVPDASTCWR